MNENQKDKKLGIFGPSSLYQKHLMNNGFVYTRAAKLDEAICALHRAICEIDNSIEQKHALDSLLGKNIRDLITEFGTIEQLKNKF
jgi:hypothetical protein